MLKKLKQFFTRLIRQPSAPEAPKEWHPKPPTPEELEKLRKEGEALAEERAEADAIAWQAMAEVWPEEDE